MLSALPLNGILGHAYDSVRDEIYHLCECIGKGAYGSVYRAVSGRGRASVLKVFTNTQKERPDEGTRVCEMVEREFTINKFMQLQMAQSYDRRFFTFVDSMFLHYAELESPRTGQIYVGLHSGCLKFEPSSRDLSLVNFCDDVLHEISDPRVHTAVALCLAELICAAVSAMNSRGVYHCDIKPANILVCLQHSNDIDEVNADNVFSYVDDLSVKLIDFSLTQVPGTISHDFCVAKNARPDLISGVGEDNRYIYLSSLIAKDPRASVSPESRADSCLASFCTPDLQTGFHLRFTEAEAHAYFKKFELFSVACVVMLMFDVEEFDSSTMLPPPIRIVPTMHMGQATDICALLKEMTGDLAARPTMDWCSVRFGIMRDRACSGLKKSRTPLIPSRAPPSPPCAPRAPKRRFRANTHPIGAV
jgi:serine/threonine protein kinase